MSSSETPFLTELAQLAADTGPALVPAGNDELLRSITEAARQLFGAAACSLALLNDEEDELHFIMASGSGAETVVGLRMPATQGIAGWVLISGEPISIDDVRRDPRFATDVAASTGYVPQSILAMPLETDRGAIGVIEVLDRSGSGIERAHDMQLLAVFARQAALAIESGRIFDDMGRALLAAAASVSDGDLAQALRDYAAKAPRARADLAELAAIFHDAGQMGDAERRLFIRVAGEIMTYLRSRAR